MNSKIITALCVLFISACASNQAPQVSHDGLELVPDTEFSEVYMKPNATLGGYTEYGLMDCHVAFKKNWLRNQNNNSLDLSSRVTQKDVDRIKDRLGDKCTEHFAEALSQAPAYNVVDSFEDGEGALVLKPSIINLDISAPDTMSAGMTRSYTTSAGEMTLSLEILDGTTGEILARVIDRRKEVDTGRMQWTSGVTNKADADRALRRWAEQLRKGLDQATNSSK